MHTMSRTWSYAMAAGALLLALLGCGGGGSEPVTGITATNFKYGQLATLTLTGNALDNVIKLSSDKCISITLGAIQSTSTRQASCIVTATGPIQFTVSSSADYVLYSTTLTSPEPVTGISTVNLKYGQTAVLTLNGEPQISALKLTADKCSNIVLDAVSTAATRTARCTVTGTGDLKFTVTNTSGGTTFYTQTVSVPEPQVTLVTTLGTMVIELNPTAMPNTVNNFLKYVNTSFYVNTIFHRVEPTPPNYVIQGGGYTSGLNLKTASFSAIKLETSSSSPKNLKYSLGMARVGPDTATSQFYVNLRDNTGFDYQNANSPGYAVFGKVISGTSVVDTIAQQPTSGTVPITDITVLSATQTQ
jgi:cyclophilin family peptidyl-prolyl cis-trans isomerase